MLPVLGVTAGQLAAIFTIYTYLPAASSPGVTEDRAQRADHPFGEKDRWVTVAPPGDSLSLSLRPADDEHRAGVDTGIQFGSTDVRATAEELIARGVRFTEFPAEQAWGSWMGEFADQDGNTYVLYDRLTD